MHRADSIPDIMHVKNNLEEQMEGWVKKTGKKRKGRKRRRKKK